MTMETQGPRADPQAEAPQQPSTSISQDCPPSSASACAGLVYRLVQNNPPKENDFRTYFELYPTRVWRPNELCPAKGLSVRTSFEAARDELRRFKARIKGATWSVAAATLDSKAGSIAQTFTDPKHYTWWPKQNFDFLAAFKVQEGAE